MSDTLTTIEPRFRTGTRSEDCGGRRYAILNTQLNRAGDIALFHTVEERQAMLDRLNTGLDWEEVTSSHYTSDRNGGSWIHPPVLDSLDATPVAEEPETREAQARALATMRQREASAIADKERYEGYYRAANAAAQESEAKLQKVWDALKEQAIERDWCSEFEEFVSENDGENYVELHKEVSVTLTITVNWRDADDESEIASALYNMERYSLESAITNYEEA